MEVKREGRTYGFWTISFFRNLVGATASVIVSLLNFRRVGPIYGQRKNFKWLVVRGVLGGISINAAFFAVQVCFIALGGYGTCDVNIDMIAVTPMLYRLRIPIYQFRPSIALAHLHVMASLSPTGDQSK